MPIETTNASALGLPPGRWSLPVIGESWQFISAPRDFLLKRSALFGPIFRSHIFGRPTILMVGPEALRFVLVTHQKHFITGRGWPKGLRVLMEGALMMKDFEEHQVTRRVLSPAFSSKALERYIPIIEHTARRYLARWARFAEFKLYDETKLLMFDVASQLLMGRVLGSEVAPLAALFEQYTRGMEGFNPVIPLPFRWTPYGRAIDARTKLLQHVTTVLSDRRKHPTDDALSLLLNVPDEYGCDLSDDELSQHVLFLLFAGHESSTSLLTMACKELCQHPGILQRARAEQTAIGPGKFSLEVIDRMEFLDRIVLEIERLYPPFSGAFRYVTRAFEFAGYHVPAGWQIFYCISGTHHLEKVHACAMSFDPDRFRPPADKDARKTCSLAGFGGGGHICIGKDLARLEVKIMLALLLRHFNVRLAEDQRFDMTFIPSVRPKSGMRVQLTAIGTLPSGANDAHQ